jgi:hypothetical protein
MIVERIDNEVLVRISGSTDPSKIQSILDYIRFIELTSNSSATQEDVDQMLAESKRNRII